MPGLKKFSMSVLAFVVPMSLVGYAQESATGVGGPQAKSAAERNRIHAPWNPRDMDRLRKEVGLIGPGTQAPFPVSAPGTGA